MNSRRFLGCKLSQVESENGGKNKKASERKIENCILARICIIISSFLTHFLDIIQFSDK